MPQRVAVKGSSLSLSKVWLALAVSAFALPLASCGGSSAGSASGAGTPVVIPTPTPTPGTTPTPTPTPTPSPTPTPTPTPALWTDAAAALYDVPPDFATCNPGVLKTTVRTEFLTRINDLRALHGLSPVTYSAVENDQVDQSSLMQAINNTLSHTPPSTWTCYTSVGAQGAGSGNLIGGWGNGLPWSTEDDKLAGWMNERYSASIGHRRWILDPFLGKVSYGRVTVQGANGYRSDAATLKVFNFAVDPPLPSSVPPFVAYPYGDYPVRYFGPGDILSFSAVVSGTSRYANANVSFASATVRVSDANGDLTVTSVASDNIGYGLPNSIQWKVTGLQQNVSYTVRITGVTGTPTSSYQYVFKIVP
jgi:uncharacterized protein YkwD